MNAKSSDGNPRGHTSDHAKRAITTHGSGPLRLHRRVVGKMAKLVLSATVVDGDAPLPWIVSKRRWASQRGRRGGKKKQQVNHTWRARGRRTKTWKTRLER